MPRRSRPAFSIIELLIVIVILGILATIVWPRIRNRGGGAVPARLVQVTPADSMLAPGTLRAVVVRAEDARGRPMSGVPVTATTDQGGVATAQWTLGGTAGPNTLTASAAGMTGAPLTITRVADPSVRGPAAP